MQQTTVESMQAQIEALRTRVAELEAQNSAPPDPSGDARRLAERVKELSTLYRVSELGDHPYVALEDYFTEAVALIPQGWQYPADTYARLIYRGATYTTSNFQNTPWQQHSPVLVNSVEVGRLTVGYLSSHSPADDGPFLSEERSLIKEVARFIGRVAERKQAEMTQQQLAAIVESSNDAIISVTQGGIIRTWNGAAARIYGYSPSEVIGAHVSHTLPPEQASELTHWLDRIRQGGETVHFETKRTHREGHDLDVAIAMSPIYDTMGRIVGVSVISRDITERKLVDASLRESDERVRVTFEQAAVGLAHVAPDGRFLRVNQKLCEIVGFSQTEILARKFQDITHPADLDADMNYVQQMLARGLSSYSMEKRYVRKDGSEIWVNLTVSLTFDLANKPKYFISVVEDISRRKAAEQALSESEARFRGLFENSPISLWEQDFSQVKLVVDSLRKQGVTDFRSHFLRNPAIVDECVGKVRLIDFNRASVELYGAAEKDELRAGLDRLLPDDAQGAFIDELVWIAEGRTSFSHHAINCRLSGERMLVRLHWTAAPGYTETLGRVLVSIEEIDEATQADPMVAAAAS
ncbi:MAG: PAS domain S-box protein [Anaerolineales bacterium]|nr:PAS domain S-box protein [Anaerolineales bacterium]